ncbi:SDR family oxidoreductase [Paenibacillus pasadenensis]|uniref:SDR family NAD(P)-dependent oxidoreductase n=1 Tax=Paenibacillus pasadenensis TaxID=217090 RepID=UPI00203AB8BA|nr:SDR family oxidoreductase [Paenibacillus pasadenensis]MCM3748399.1 SDR family oxidoreductase [Paenibacillus pasadenensis]
MELNLQNKRAIVTGGSKGIGFATAMALSLEGAKVAIIARTAAELKEAAARIRESTGGEVLAVQGDVSDEASASTAVQSIAQAWNGGIDILINNAGTAAAAPFDKADAPAWKADLDLKLLGAVNMTQAALPYMKDSGGAVVNVTAIGGKTPPKASLPSSVTRAAGIALTKAMSRDLAEFGIRVNAVCIGLIRSAQIEAVWRRTSPELTWEQYARDSRHDIPLGRIGDTAEAANAIVFLASGAASYVTGTALNIDGGKSPVT